jgi:hypothetical protein
MFGQGLDCITDSVRQDQELIEALEIAATQYQAWQKRQIQIRSQILYDFRLASFPSSDQVCDVLQHYQVFVDVLRFIADQIEVEIDETMDQFYTWFYD